MHKEGYIQAVIGERIRTLRKSKGYSQQKLAELANISYKYLGEVERAQQNPTLQTIYQISVGLEVALPDLVQIEEVQIEREEVEKEIHTLVENALKSLDDMELNRLRLLLRLLLPPMK